MNEQAADILQHTEVRERMLALRPDRDPREVAARVAWSVLVEPGDGVAGALVASLGPAEALTVVFDPSSSSALRSVCDDPGRPAVRALADAGRRWRARWSRPLIADAATEAVRCGIRLLLPGDEDWPKRFADLGTHGPQALWFRGEPEALGALGVAVVGARASSAYGEHVTTELCGDLARDGLVVFSGGAYGIDGAAHRAALRAGGRTVAFLAGGAERPYPSGHTQLLRRIEASGAVASELPCGSAPTRWRFLARNRLIGAAAAATVVVEAGRRSGSLNTAGHAASMGRPLGAVPGPVTSATSEGCHRLLREYDAQCVVSAADVRELLGLSVDARPEAPCEEPDMLRLSDALSTRVQRNEQELARLSGLSVGRVQSLLGILDLDGGVLRGTKGWLASPP